MRWNRRDDAKLAHLSCPVLYLGAQADPQLDERTPGAGTAAARAAVAFVGRQAGVWDLHVDERFASAQLVDPSRVAFVRTASHSFSTLDSRIDYGVLGANGGDVGEFILAVAALERTMKMQFSEDDVRIFFDQWLQELETLGHRAVTMPIDDGALRRILRRVGATSFQFPSRDQARLLAELGVDSEYIGDRFLRDAVAKPELFGLRPGIAESVLKAFYRVYFGPGHPLQRKVAVAVASGYIQPAGMLRVHYDQGSSPQGRCAGAHPAVVPHGGGSSYLVHNPEAVAVLRQQLAAHFANLLKLDEATTDTLAQEMNMLGSLHLAKALQRFGPQVPVVDVLLSVERPTADLLSVLARER